MKKITCAIFSVLAAFAISGAYADQSPESIVSCAHNGWFVGGYTVPAAISAELCTPGATADKKCATCISSLEDQGCELIDVDLQTFRFVEEADDLLVATYLLSCDGR